MYTTIGISPRHWDKKKAYPVVVNLHGYLGNWLFYQGLFMNLDDCIVLSPGTSDLSGKWTKQDLQDILKHQLKFLERVGYKIDRNRIHLITHVADILCWQRILKK